VASHFVNQKNQHTLLLIGHFTPPIHGMAVAMDTLGDLLATLGPVLRIRTVPRRVLPRKLHHLSRVWRVTVALATVVLMRRKSRAALLSVDAGYGMVYTIVLTLAARCLRYDLALDHHSYAYVSEPSSYMAVLVAVAGGGATHIFQCELACRKFKRIYRRTARTRIGSRAYILPNPPDSGPRDNAPGRALTLGHLSNLSMEKGLDDVLRFGREAISRGLADKVVLAGRTTGPLERDLVNRGVADGYVDYRGRVSSAEKETFFGDVDVFLFPTRYKNELAPGVVWEALLRGVPVIAYRAGCMTQEALGSSSLVVDAGQDFIEIGLQRLATWVRSPEVLSKARQDSIRIMVEERGRAIADALNAGRSMFAHWPSR
jgi:glycosyltransferase involved in cell wall biosynthesis